MKDDEMERAREAAILEKAADALANEVLHLRDVLAKIDEWCCPLLCTNCRDNRATAKAALAKSAMLDVAPVPGEE
jgi:hypothetical protein